MKTALPIAVIAGLLFIGVLVWHYFAERDSVELHKRAWWACYERARERDTRQAKNITTFTVFRDDLVRRIQGRSLGEIKGEHERALIRLGYLMTNDFVLTNQVLTRQFGSNFWRMLRGRYGTNREAIWMYHNNRDRIHATLPSKDLPEWERIFRDCAARYASNIPPAAITNSPN